MGCFCYKPEKERNKEIISNKRVENIEKKNNTKLQVVGFDNIGNSCYINSFLQIIIHCPNFMMILNDLNEINPLKYPLISCLINLAENYEIKYLEELKFLMRNNSSYNESYKESDSQMFGKDLINEIINNIKAEDEISNSLSSYSNNSIIQDKEEVCRNFTKKYETKEIIIEKMFMVTELITLNKNNKSFCEKSLEIELHFPKDIKNEYSLYDLLDFKYNNKDKNKNNIVKLLRLPDILIITIIRAKIRHKLITYLLEYPEKINFTNYFEENNSNKEKSKYELFGINIKKGKSKNSGHYYCYVCIRNIWHYFNDKEVLIKPPELSSNGVVGLFYRRIKENPF